MQPALKLTNDLNRELSRLLPQDGDRYTTHQDAPPANVVRPTFTTMPLGSERVSSAPSGAGMLRKPELSAAIDVVGRAADLIKSAGERLAQAEQRTRSVAELSETRLAAAQDEIRTLRERAEALEGRLANVSESAAQKIADADGQIRALREQSRNEERRLAELETVATEQARAYQASLKDANERIVAADTRAVEARDDLEYLKNYIRDCFRLPEQA